MQSKQISINTEIDVNVPPFCNHIGDSICSHEVGTLAVSDVLYYNGEIQVRQDTQGSYHHNDITFEINDGWFISEGLRFELPQRTEINTFERIALSLGMPLSKASTNTKINITDLSLRELPHVLTMLALKDLKIIPNSFAHRKQYSYGINVFEAYYKAVSGSGRIKAIQKNIRWLNEQDAKQLKANLFTTSNYLPGSHSMKYEPTEFAEKIMASVYKLFKMLEFKQNDIDYKVLDFVVTVEELGQIRLRDVILLISDCIGYDNGLVIRPRLEDRQYSRIYSVFTSISSNTRKILGFYNQDIGAALQTICLQLVKDPSLYPLHQELVNDKQTFRSRVQVETDKDIKWVKKELSKIDNLDSMPKRYKNYPTLKAYYQESQQLRKEIIASAEPIILSRAMYFAKPTWKEVWIKDKKEPMLIMDGLKESSIFFFIWTQWERLIRESMMSCFADPSACHQVHDAVYSRQQLDPKAIEEKVLKDTGFVVQISTD